MRIAQATLSIIDDMWAQVVPGVQQSNYLEDAAHRLATGIHNQFDESVVIVRIFLAATYGELPNANQEYVKKLAESADVQSELKPAKKN